MSELISPEKAIFAALGVSMMFGTLTDVAGYTDFLNGTHPAIGVATAILAVAIGKWVEL
jgi:hypothetical protein